MRTLRLLSLVAWCACAALLSGSGAAYSADKEISVWTMGGDAPGWVKWLEAIRANFEARNPGAKVKLTFYEKNALATALTRRCAAAKARISSITSPTRRNTPRRAS